MKVLVTGATGLIGSNLIDELKKRDYQVTVLSRNPERAEHTLGVHAFTWNPAKELPPQSALNGKDAVIHLAGEPIAQRWTNQTKAKIKNSRSVGTANLVTALSTTEIKPSVLISSSAVGYYGPRGDERISESTPPGSDFLADVCKEWEAKADKAAQFNLRVVNIRTGVVIDPRGGALAKMLPPFKLGVGGPVGSGNQFIPWISVKDLVGMIITALNDQRWRGPVNATAPEPVTNKEFSRTLAKVLKRPAVFPVPPVALKILYGEMAQVVTTGQRAVPEKALKLGYNFIYPDLKEALQAALAKKR